MPSSILVYALVTLLFSPTGKVVSDFVVVVSSESKIKEIDSDDLKSIFLGKNRRVQDFKVVPVMLKAEKLQEAFFKKHLKRTKIQFARTWQKLVFTGKGKRPKVFNSVEELTDYLKDNPETLSFVPKGNSLKGLKEVKIK